MSAVRRPDSSVPLAGAARRGPLAAMRAGYARLTACPPGAPAGAYVLGRGALFCLLAVLPFSHNAALRNLALLGLLASTVWLAARRRLAVDWRSPVWLALGGLLAIFGATAAFGTAPVDSLGELRKHFLPGVLMLLLVPVVCPDAGWRRGLLAVVGFSFALRAGLTLAELAVYFPDLDAGRNEGLFIKGFSLDAGLYVPALVGLGLLGGRARWPALFALLPVGVGMVLTQSRTPLLAVLAAVVAMLLALRCWRPLLVLLAVALLAGGGLAVKQPAIAERFASSFDPATYVRAFDVKNFKPAEGFAARLPIWAGVLEIGQSRSLAGYGFGWKKLAGVAETGGYIARWAAHPDDAFAREQVAYFSLPPGKVNPHNLYLEVYFEGGLLGLAAYAALLLVLFRLALGLAWRAPAPEQRVVGAVVLGYLIDHVLLGLADGLWFGLGPSLALVGLLETVRRSEGKA